MGVEGEALLVGCLEQCEFIHFVLFFIRIYWQNKSKENAPLQGSSVGEEGYSQRLTLYDLEF